MQDRHNAVHRYIQCLRQRIGGNRIRGIFGRDGFVRVVDYMGGDEAIVQAARISYGRGEFCP